MTIERTLKAAGEGPIILALSGGGDSVALLHIMIERVGGARLRAIIVDHVLREGSAADAGRAAGFARALGVRAEVKRLDWAGAPKRSQQAARRARYIALAQAAREHGARTVAVAHTADDQAETVFMRAAKGSGWRGLAGMAEIAPAPIWPEGRGVLLARPLLGQRRAELRDFLSTRGAEWIEDPANTNPTFERVRVRARLAALEGAGFDPMRLVRFAAELRALADQVDAEAAALISRAVRFEGPDILVDLTSWAAPLETRRRALSALIAAAAGAEREPAPAALARLDARLAEPSFRGAALGGARLARRGDTLRLSRDPGAIEGRAGLAPLAAMKLTAGQEAVWDGRLELRARQPVSVLPGAGAPLIALEERHVQLEAAVALGAVSARWLTELQLNRQLGPHSTTKSGL
ncbi:MAG: tRNA lysidine(34) synthetase TilS [Hyphomonadaceae bacterium]|nr:tRNA lysidine(34) synthetase TilS [Hyphomonadaceae bacterium]